MASKRVRRLVDFVLWVAVASSVVVVASLVLGVVVGRDLLTGKYVLFVVGFLLFGLGSFLIQPSRPRDETGTVAQSSATKPGVPGSYSTEAEEVGGGSVRQRAPDVDGLRARLGAPATHQHRFEAKIQELDPLADEPLPYPHRIGREYKIFATGLVVLAVSLGMEVVGITV